MSTKTIPELWDERQRLRAEKERSYSQEDAAHDAVPGWAFETSRKIARHEMVGLTNDLPEERYEEARRAIAELETKDYIAAMEPYEAWDRHSCDLFSEQISVERAIGATPATSINEVLVKLRIAGLWIESENTVDGVLCEGDIDLHDSLTLSACRDLERLSDGGMS